MTKKKQGLGSGTMQETEHLLRRKGRAGWIGIKGGITGRQGRSYGLCESEGMVETVQDWLPVGPQS